MLLLSGGGKFVFFADRGRADTEIITKISKMVEKIYKNRFSSLLCNLRIKTDHEAGSFL